MSARTAQHISDVIGQFRLSSVTIEKELSDWDAEDMSLYEKGKRCLFFLTDPLTLDLSQ